MNKEKVSALIHMIAEGTIIDQKREKMRPVVVVVVDPVMARILALVGIATAQKAIENLTG